VKHPAAAAALLHCSSANLYCCQIQALVLPQKLPPCHRPHSAFPYLLEIPPPCSLRVRKKIAGLVVHAAVLDHSFLPSFLAANIVRAAMASFSSIISNIHGKLPGLLSSSTL
jgi:hypothetical protein